MGKDSIQANSRGPSYRILLLIFEFCAPTDLLETIPLVCKGWKRCANVDELWLKFISGNVSMCSRASGKQLYLQIQADSRKAIVIIEGRNLVQYSFPHLQSSSVVLLAPFIPVDYAQWVSLPDGTVFLSGGFIRDQSLYSDSGYLIHQSTNTVLEVPRMMVKRGNHGLAYAGGTVYVFGGFNGKFLRHVEKFQVGTGTWKRVADMSFPRSHFTPTVFHQSIYVAGGASKAIEELSLKNERFETLPFSLSASSFSVTLLHTPTQLIALQKNVLLSWTIKPKRGFRPQVLNLPLEAWESKMQPVYLQKQAYFLDDLSNSIYRIDLETLEVRQLLFRPNCFTFVLNVKARK